jgi:hypothetical protein
MHGDRAYSSIRVAVPKVEPVVRLAGGRSRRQRWGGGGCRGLRAALGRRARRR